MVNPHFLRNFLGLCAVLVSQAATAQALPVLGIELGAPLALKACNGGNSPKAGLCKSVRSTKTVDGRKIVTFEVRLPDAEWPSWSRYPYYTVLEVNGKAERLAVFTRGAQAQEEVVRQLTTKFGKPSSQSVQPVQNKFGAKFQSVAAEWSKPPYQVRFDGIVSEIDWGMLVIQSPAGAEAEKLLNKNSPKALAL